MLDEQEAPSTKLAPRRANLLVVAIILSAGLTHDARGQPSDATRSAAQGGSLTARHQLPESKDDAPVENITVTGTRSHQVIETFVHGRVVAARLTGKIARWTDRICPITIGLPPAIAKIITARVKELGTSIGAPVNGKDDCRANIEIVFTLSPQLLIDQLREHHDVLLGYADNSDERARLSKVTRTIQAWYTTATEGLHGSSVVDSSKTVPAEMEITIPDPSGGGIIHYTVRAQHGFLAGSGSRLGDGLRSKFYNVIIVANPSKLLGYEYETIGDYIGLLALAQINPPDNCQSLASILNLLTQGCTLVKTLTENDLAYLRGLYKMSPNANLAGQEDEIAYRMEQDFRGH